MKQSRFLPALIVLILFLASSALLLRFPHQTLSATTHLVISEIQVRGVSDTDDEFVELYNPTGLPVDLAQWRLTQKTAVGNENILVASMSGTIPAHGYFLITSNEALASGSADLLYSNKSTHLAASNSATLYSDAGITVVDLVGMGNATAKETTTVDNPVNGGSIERKANSSSTTVSMGIGGADEFAGSGEDTDNNSNDFVQRTVSQPQNSTSAVEPILTSPVPTPSESPQPSSSPETSPEMSPSPSATPEPSSSPEISPTPSVTPIASASPEVSSTPSATPTASPSVEPSATPTSSLTPTPTPSPTPVPSTAPSPSPSVTPSPSPITRILFSGFLFRCYITYQPIWFGNVKFSFPSFTCVHL